jgi:hemerythrin-like domain-containing protein
MDALRIIGEEHQSLAAILHAVRYMLKEIAAGRLSPDLPLLQAMVHYLDAYAERLHHPKEDLLFARLAERSGEAAEALSLLARQHADAPQRIARLQAALDAYAGGGSFADFAAAFDVYADFYRGHMMLEEERVLPLLPDRFTEADRVELDAAFRDFGARAAREAAGGEDFGALFRRMVERAPAPIGFGQTSTDL